MKRLVSLIITLAAISMLIGCEKDDSNGNPLTTVSDSTVTIVSVRNPGWEVMNFYRYESAQGALVDVELELASLERTSGYSPVIILSRENVLKTQWQWDVGGNLLPTSCNTISQFEANAQFDWEYFNWVMPCESETVCHTNIGLASHTFTLPDGLSQYRLHFRVWLVDGTILEGVYDFYHELVH